MSLTTYDIFASAFYILWPILILYLGSKVSIMKKIGPLTWAFLSGIIFGNLFPAPASHLPIRNIFSGYLVPIALPLLLVSTNLVEWAKLAGKRTVKAFGLAFVASVVYNMIAGGIFAPYIAQGWILGGGLAAMTLGATLNIVAVGNALGMEPLLLAVSPMLAILTSVPHVAFLASGKNVMAKLLKVDEVVTDTAALTLSKEEIEDLDGTSWEVYMRLVKRLLNNGGQLLSLLFMITLSVLTLNFFLYVAKFVSSAWSSVVPIIGCSLAGVVYSFIKPLSKIKGTFQAGMLLVFIMAPAMTAGANVRVLTAELLLTVGLFIAGSFYVTTSIFFLLCKFFNIDRDTAMTVNMGCIHSPAMVPPVAAHLENRQSLISGIAAGILGYAAANFVGLAVAYALRAAFY